MPAMIVFPAIDLRRGRCVRLRQGDPDAETVFGDDPAAMARRWAAVGATWLHVVNLDGALGDAAQAAVNLRALQAIRAAVEIPLQFGGGIRSLDDVRAALELGADRVILGTVAVRQPALLGQAVAQFGAHRIVAGLDTRAGRVATHGWQEQSDLTAAEIGNRLRDLGVEWVVHTDIGRDAMLTGVNAAESAQLAADTGLKVIASGGVAGMQDIRALLALEDPGVVGVITGQALYTGALDLGEALALTQARARRATSEA